MTSMNPHDPKLLEHLRRREVAEYVLYKALADPVQRIDVDIPVETVRETVKILRKDVQVLLETIAGSTNYADFLKGVRTTGNRVEMTSLTLARVLVGTGIAHVVSMPGGDHWLRVSAEATSRGWPGAQDRRTDP